jgi:hypothetical protein
MKGGWQRTFLLTCSLWLIACVGSRGRPFIPPVVSTPHCAIGASGPTVHPWEAIYNAEADALTNLVLSAPTTTVAIKSVSVDVVSLQRFRQVSREHAKGHYAGARIVRLWMDKQGRGIHKTKGVVYALACDEEGQRSVGIDRRFAEFVDTPGVPCALGVAGPTIGLDQKELAFENARSNLSELLSVDVETIMVDYDLAHQDIWSDIHTPEHVSAMVEQKAHLKHYLLDSKGTGPLGLDGVAYALACLP